MKIGDCDPFMVVLVGPGPDLSASLLPTLP